MNFNEMLKYSMNKNVFFDPADPTRDRALRVIRRIGRSLERRLRLQYVACFSEQPIEYALFYQSLRAADNTVLDFGCVENILPMTLCSLGYRVTGLDFLPYPFTHANFTFIRHDILAWQPPPGAFDVVVSISTIEHVGLGYSGDPVANAGDKRAVEALWKALRPGGRLFVTLPAGRPTIRRGYRTYDEATVRGLVPSIERLRFFAKPSRRGAWREVEAAEIGGIVYEDYEGLYPTQAVAIVEARKPEQESS